MTRLPAVMPAGKTMVRRCSIQVNNELDLDVMISQRVLGAFYVGLSASCFGAMAIFARHAYAGGAEALAVLFVRFALAAGVMIVIMNRRQIRWPRGRALIILSLMGGVGYVSQSFSFFSALNHASAGLVALLLYLYPFIVIVIETVFMRRKLTRQRLVAVLLALSGTALILGQGLTGQPLGVLLGVAAALIYSVYIVVGAQVLDKEDPLAAATVVMCSAALVFGVIALIVRPAYPADLSAWSWMVAIALVSTVVAMVSLFAGLKRLGAADTATLSTLEPVVTVVLASAFLGESLLPLQVFGGMLVLGTVVWLARSAPRQPPGDAVTAQDEASSGRNAAS